MLKLKTDRNANDVNGVSRRTLKDKEEADRRWRNDIADDVEALEPKGTAHRIARRLRDG